MFYLKVKAAEADCIAVILLSALSFLWKKQTGRMLGGVLYMYHRNMWIDIFSNS